MTNKAIPASSGLYAITDCKNLTNDELIKKSDTILNAGVALFQYRNKEANQQKKKELAKELQLLCQQYKTPFIVNDDVALAKGIAADGIHLGQDDKDIKNARETLGSIIVGVSCYNDLNRAIVAEKDGADYVAFGTFFPSLTKPDANKATIELLLKAKSTLTIPIVAIGGITPENGKQLINANVDFLAIISGLYSATDTASATKAYKHLFK
ncbi:MAG TPA: thiamine phosphate synthase [Thiotrichaceae bacterium]|jgi:thiamine-phosphate pyrophosphorylase|nr:thiamine phosphate synthase [Thiotrichaceae bacterium]HIM07341.1 thiamine phosphate synthase [Gammaproteobacteria bacterium]